MGKYSSGISFHASVGRGALAPPPTKRTPMSFGCVSREIPYDRSGNNRTRTPQTLARTVTVPRPQRLTALKPSPLGEGGTSASVSEPERADEGLNKDGSSVIDDPSPPPAVAHRRTPVPHCHCEERNARRGNLPEGKTDDSHTNNPNTRPHGLRAKCPWRLTALKPSPLGEGGTSASVSEPSDG